MIPQSHAKRASDTSTRSLDRRGTKRKLEAHLTQIRDNNANAQTSSFTELEKCISDLTAQASYDVDHVDYNVVRKAVHSLADACKNEAHVDFFFSQGALEVLKNWLKPQLLQNASIKDVGLSVGDDILKEVCFLVGRLAIKPDYQNKIAACGFIPLLVDVVRSVDTRCSTPPQPGSGGVARRACDAITNLAHENMQIKACVRREGGIEPLVLLLDSNDSKVQRAAAGALRTLAFKNEENKNKIVECDALPVLIQMLQSEDTATHYEAIGTLGNLVHSSPPIKDRVLRDGALQPVIGLLSSSCSESKREAALLLGQFATAEPDYKVKIAQRGAIPPLIEMLEAADDALKEMAAFALGRLAQNSDNQAGVVHLGGLRSLLRLLTSTKANLQHNAAFALYGLSGNSDNVAPILRESGYQLLKTCECKSQQSTDCVEKTLKKLQEKLHDTKSPQVCLQVTALLRSADIAVRQNVACALAHLASEEQLHHVFIDRGALDVLLHMVVADDQEASWQRQAAEALSGLFQKLNQQGDIVACEPNQPAKCVYLGPQYVNNPSVHDVVFTVEGKPFCAHKVALCASSEAFRCMFEGGYRESGGNNAIEIPNIRWEVFEAMMRFVYTGELEVPPELAEDLLQAADQYLLVKLKTKCEDVIARSIDATNLSKKYELAEAYCATSLSQKCVLFALEKYDELLQVLGSAQQYGELLQGMNDVLRATFMDAFTAHEMVVPRQLDQFYKANKRLPLEQGAGRTNDEVALAEWLISARERKRKNKLPACVVSFLDANVFEWDTASLVPDT